ncbi:MAG: oligosaccharide flippase family protein [Syntrophomonas sp.]
MHRIQQYIRRQLPVGSFSRNVVTLMSGTTIAQALLILVSPILTRLYSPDDFGIYALYISILGILSVISCWRYELAIVLPEEDDDAANLLVLSILICVGMALLSLIMVGLCRIPVAYLLKAPELAPWLWFLPFSLLLTGLFKALNYWCTRRRQFKSLAVRQITQSIVTAITQISSGMTIYARAGGLIGGQIFGQTIATVKLAWDIWREDRLFLNHTSIKGIKEQAVVYKEFPLYQIGAALFNSFSAMVPTLLLGYFFSPAVVGLYALGQKVVASPMGIINGSVSQVFFPRAELARRQGNLDDLVISTFKHLLSIGLFPIAVLAIIGPQLIGFVFGVQWVQAGVILRLLSPYLLLNFLSAPISAVFSVLGKQKEYLLFNIVYFILAVSALVFGGLKDDAQLAISLFGTIAAILYGYFGIKIIKMSGGSLRTAWQAISKVLKDVSIFMVPLLVVQFFQIGAIVIIILSLILTICYFFYISKNKL